MSNSTRNPDMYRPCVGIMLINPSGLVFVARRIDTISEAWQMPQGGIDQGENPRDALFREMREETGTDKAVVLSELDKWLYYDLPKDIQKKLWGGKYLGQRQRWFALNFTGKDSDINLETEEPEFLEWKWVQPSKVIDLAVPFKRDIYTEVFKSFSSFLA